ncbi:MAG: LysR family transcriptional regulator [Nitratireductor sp.]|nr:LysR family transcriptional regulator [Nitratireductor sp.]
MELYQIRYFLAVSRTLNFTQAADACNVTQPALTRAIKKLEEELGGDLFRRERTRSHLTELGKAMVPLLQQSYDAANAAKAEAESYGRGTIAPLRIGISETVSSSFLHIIIAQLQQAVSGLDLALMREPAGRVSELLESGEIDFGILAASDESAWDRIRSWPLFDEDFVLCGVETDVETGVEAGENKAPLSALGELAMVLRPYCENQDSIRDYLGEQGISIEHRHKVSCDADLAALIEAGGTGVLLPKSSAARLNLQWMGLKDSPLRRTVVLIEAAGRQHNAAGSRFVRLMRSADWSNETGVNEPV